MPFLSQMKIAKTMKTRSVILSLFLAIGFTFQNCNPFEVDCNCKPITKPYFDIQGIELIQYKKRGECCADKLANQEEVFLSDYSGLSINFKAENIALNESLKAIRVFSLMSSASACSCFYDGELGSKNERLKSLNLITLNNFDKNHLANDTINDLFNVNLFGNRIDLNKYLSQDTSLIKYNSILVELKKAPDLNEEFKVKVVMGLSTSETYESVSYPIKIKK